MEVKEHKKFTQDYLDPNKRSIGNALQVFFKDGTKTDRVEVDYPVGHRRRRAEGIPLLQTKFSRNIATRLSPRQCEKILYVCGDQGRLEATSVHAFMDLWAM
jgi:2-methylcitrate dehydratase